MKNKKTFLVFSIPCLVMTAALALLSGCGGGKSGGGTAITAEGGYIYDSEWSIFNTTPTTLKFPSCIAADSSAAYICDYYNHRILKVSKTGVFMLAFNSDNAPDDTVSPGPNNITFDTSGNLYIANTDEAAVVKFNTSGSKQSTSYASQKLFTPTDAAIAAGSVYVSDTDLNAVSRYDAATGNFLSSSGKVTVSASETITFKSPNAIAADSTNLYLSNTYNNQILKLDTNMNFAAKWGTQGSGAGQFSQPAGIFVSTTKDEVFVADTGNHRIQKFSKAGTFLSAFGRLGSGPGQFNGPVDVFVDSSTGYVYVADATNNRIQVFRPL